jgi:Ribbon-helix-helix domain
MRTTSITARFDRELASDLKNLAKEKGVSISFILREGAALYTKLLKGRTEEAQRKLLTSEYLTLAIDLIISSQYPADRDKFLLEAGRRVEGIDATA